ncbi:MAG: DUF1674 domain-containing protein [Pseudomonadota bacterium]
MPDDKIVTQKPLSPAAERALAEAEERRAQQQAKEAELEAARQSEKGGPKKVEPIRYGDWERNGIAYDF